MMPSNVGAVAVRTEAAVSPVMFGGGGASRPAKKPVKKVRFIGRYEQRTERSTRLALSTARFPKCVR